MCTSCVQYNSMKKDMIGEILDSVPETKKTKRRRRSLYLDDALYVDFERYCAKKKSVSKLVEEFMRAAIARYKP